MSNQPTWLLEHRRNVFSQTGEDGIIEKILGMIPSCNGWCVEFGAWDGRHLSNAANLIVNKAYSAVLIEGDPERYAALKVNYARNSRVIPVRAFVGFGDADGLDQLLSQTPIPADFDVLSIDIDGNDYHVWAAVNKYSPKVVCIGLTRLYQPRSCLFSPRTGGSGTEVAFWLWWGLLRVRGMSSFPFFPSTQCL